LRYAEIGERITIGIDFEIFAGFMRNHFWQFKSSKLSAGHKEEIPQLKKSITRILDDINKDERKP
jgi:hypothetical protein